MVLGAAGGVGLAAVELAVVLGARVAAAASTESYAMCLAKGADAAIDSEHRTSRSGSKRSPAAGPTW